MKKNILVIGGTGKTGRKVVQNLQALQHHVRVGSRKATPAFDWENQDTWPTALEGIDAMYVTFQPDLAVPGAYDSITALVDLAQQSGIKKMVLLSGKGEKEAERCEQIVIQSDIDHTIIRANWFNQNFSESFLLEPILAGHVALPQAEAKVPYVDTGDIAAVATEVLLNDQHNGQIYELTGPTALTFEEVVHEIATATGRSIQFTPISMDAYTQMLKEIELPADYIWLLNYLFTEVLPAAENNKITADIEKVLGRKPKSFSTFVSETAATGVWNPAVVETA
ncbi:MAG: NAD(P)H-binding protein [Saprospiraceae bacterium]|nr:NAD(P)H-binding protein [Saprospiraceae bacterium]